MKTSKQATTRERRVVMDELEPEGKLLAMNSDEAAALSLTGLVDVRPEFGGEFRVLPCGKVGAVRIGDLQVQVTPKKGVGLSRLLFLLGYAKNPGFRPEDVHGPQEDELWPALGESLARMVERATARGALQGYQTREEALPVVRGRILIGEQIARRPGQMVPIEVRFDEFTIDIPENQILRTAIRRMLGVPRLAQGVRSRLLHLDGRLAEVSMLRPGAPLPAWRETRLNAHYAHALRLAAIVLQYGSVEAGAGSVRVAAFVVDMAKVFEDFVATALKESLAKFGGDTQDQYKTQLDVAQSRSQAGIRMQVDLVHLVDGKPSLVFDAKYKVAKGEGQYPNADHYQMLAYCTALNLPTAWLVYADAGSMKRRQIINTDIEIFEYPLDLSREPKDLLQEVDRLAAAAWRRWKEVLAAAA